MSLLNKTQTQQNKKHIKNLPTHCFWLESHCVKGQQAKSNLKKIFS